MATPPRASKTSAPPPASPRAASSTISPARKTSPSRRPVNGTTAPRSCSRRLRTSRSPSPRPPARLRGLPQGTARRRHLGMELLRRHHHPGSRTKPIPPSAMPARSPSTNHVALLRAMIDDVLREHPVPDLRAESLADAHPGRAPGRLHHGQGAPGPAGGASTASITCIAMSNCCSAVRPVVASASKITTLKEPPCTAS